MIAGERGEPRNRPLSDMTTIAILPPAPAAVLGADGRPNFGRFAGRVERIDWNGLAAPWRRGPIWRRLHHKRWRYVGIATPDVFIGVAVVDIGWAGAAFAYVFDRGEGAVVGGFSRDGLPGLSASVGDRPGAGASSFFRFGRDRIDYRHAADGEPIVVAVRTREMELEAEIDAVATPPWLLAVGPIGEGGSVHGTQKTTAMSLRGWAAAGGRRYGLDAGSASIDYSNGLLARETRWRWASAHAPGIGFNLQDGYFGGNENVLWLDGQPIALGAARFAFDATNPGGPWRVSTDDGLLDLDFAPAGLRREDRDLGLAASRYVQPVGTFSGTVRASADSPVRRVSDLLGVTEDHFSRW